MPLDVQRADIACNFFERVLRHTMDEWYGKLFILSPWQEDIISELFGRVDDRGQRLINTAYVEVPKKAGKTEMCAGIALLCLVMDPNPGCQVYSAAAAQRQALNVFRAATKMVEQSPHLSKILRVMRSTNRIIKRADPESFYAAIAADGDLTDGVNPSCVIADELHRWRTRKAIENWDVLSLGGITRRHTLAVAITTAGVKDESPLAYRYHEKAERIRDGVIDDPTFLGRIYGASLEDDWTDEATWIKANPSLKENGGFLDLAKIRERYIATQSDPDAQMAFRRYYLNMWEQSEIRAIKPEDWRRGDLELGALVDRPCYAGLDLGSTTDLTALVLVFPPDQDDYWDVLPFFWMPADNAREREIRDKVPYARWIRDGHMIATEGNVIDYRAVREKLTLAREVFDVREVAFDPWHATQLSLELIDDGFVCVPIRQGFASLSEPLKKLLSLVAEGKIRHAGHPVLRWNADCLSLRSDNNDNIRPVKPDRGKDSKRIDGMAALINALARIVAAEDKTIAYTPLRMVG